MSQCAKPDIGAGAEHGAGPRGYGNKLVLIYNMACPLKCDFCCHPVEDYGPVKMKKADAIDWIRQSAEVEDVGLVAFTGGEPFLYYDDLLDIFAATRRPELRFRIVTAAHWAESHEIALAKLLPLRDRGLSELSISTDPSHQKFVPGRYAENAARAAIELGMVAELGGVYWDAEQEMEDTIDVPLGALVLKSFVAPVGRAKTREITAETYGLRGDDRRFGSCGDPPYYDITVYPDGNVYPCCSGGFQIDAKLLYGNLLHDRMTDVWERMRADRYARLVISVGLSPVYRVAELKFPDVYAQLPERENIASICELCALVHADADLMHALEPVLAYLDHVIEVQDEAIAAADSPAPASTPPA